MKDEFLAFLNDLLKKANMTEADIPENVKLCLDAILNDKKMNKPILTEKGVAVLGYLQQNPTPKDGKAIAAGLGVSSRGLSGVLLKLVNDGFCDKMGKDPTIYSITEKGKNFNID